MTLSPKVFATCNIGYNLANVENMNAEREGITFVQFSDKLLTPDSIMRDYYRQAYSKMDGYYFPEHYMEIPYWIPTIAGALPPKRYDKRSTF